jgi:hypothetical protein
VIRPIAGKLNHLVRIEMASKVNPATASALVEHAATYFSDIRRVSPALVAASKLED